MNPPFKAHPAAGVRSAIAAVVAAASALVLACAPDSGSEDSVVARDSAGIAIIESRSPTWTTQQGWSLGESPRLQVGLRDGSADQEFSTVIDAALLPDGVLVVADLGSNELRFFAPGPRHIRTVGRTGRGPMEFMALRSVEVVGDSLYVFDASLDRLSVLTLAGDPIRTAGFGPVDRISLFRYSLVGTVGAELLFGTLFFQPVPRRPAAVYADSAPNLVYSQDGRPAGTLGEPVRMDLFGETDGGGPQPFGRMSALDTDGSSLFIGDGATYEIRVYSAIGELVRIIRRAWEPQRVTPVLVDELVRMQMDLYGVAEGDARAAAIREPFERLPLPEHTPAFGQLVVASSGHIWTQDYRPVEDGGDKQWSVFDPQGRWLGRVSVPGRHRLLDAGPDYILGIWRDDLGVESVRVYDIEVPYGG
ncbi:MAG: hypothetical protein ACREL7_13310 [Longimicrobiales bacterium]